MKKALIIMMAFALSLLYAAEANELKAGKGVANDHATSSASSCEIDYVVRGGGNEYGYRGYKVPIGLTVLAWAAPNSESEVNGLRLNLGAGSYKHTTGFDLGLFSSGEEHGVLGINVFGHFSTKSAAGWEIGLVNVSCGDMAGLQIGLVNYAKHLAGVQIGLINIASEQWSIPILNIAW